MTLPGYLQTDQETDRDRLALLAAALRRSQSTGDLEDREETEQGEPSPGLDLHQDSTDLEVRVVTRSIEHLMISISMSGCH